MLKKEYPQKFYLFIAYGVFILILLIAFFIYYFYSYSKSVYIEAKTRLENNCASISSSVETALDNLSVVSMNIVYSKSIRQDFKEFSSADGFIETRPGIQSIYNSIISMIGVFQSVSQVNLYTLKNEVVGTGFYQHAIYTDLDEKEWLVPTIEQNGRRYITVPFFNRDIPTEGENRETHMFIALTRVFFNEGGEAEGVVEVIQDCHKIFTLIPNLRSNTPSMKAYVYNERGELVYPYWDVDAPKNLLAISQGNTNKNGLALLEDGTEAMMVRQEDDKYGFTVILFEPKDAVFAAFYKFRNGFFMIAMLAATIIILICLFISEQLTRPLKRLTLTVKDITLNNVLRDGMDWNEENIGKTNVREISLLYQALQFMQEQIRLSLKQLLISHTEETKAKFQVTQSIINPHFLYNSLTTISVMAEEEMNDEIVHMCNMLCSYFRYISDTSVMFVPLSKEMLGVEQFISCMKIRFGEDFEYLSSSSEEVGQVIVPKLIIQPFVENAFKYAFTITPPWKMTIRAYQEDKYWFVEIEDNGIGISEQKRIEMIETFQLIRTDESISMNIGGMGLKNVYLRMKLLYGEEAVFVIDNSKKGRTIFRIGGLIDQEREGMHGFKTSI